MLHYVSVLQFVQPNQSSSCVNNLKDHLEHKLAALNKLIHENIVFISIRVVKFICLFDNEGIISRLRQALRQRRLVKS